MPNNISIFAGNGDPILGQAPDFGAQYQELERMQQVLEQRKQELAQVTMQPQARQAAQASKTPVWDEIDRITGEMSDKEFEALNGFEEYQESAALINSLVAAAQMKMLRPYVEGSTDGKDALDKHLTLIKRLRKSVAKNVDDELRDFEDYKENYSDMTYSEYQKMKGGRKGGKK